MTDRCEPPPELRGKPGYHLVAGVDNVTGQIGEFPAYWTGEGQRPFARMWEAWGVVHEPDEHGWRYLSPVATPAEVDALRAERDAAIARTAAACANAVEAYDEVRAECDTLRARVAELEGAILWALGEGDSDFGDKMPADGRPRFWWRRELATRAALSPATEG